MPEIRTARQIAEHIIRDAVTDIEWGDIGDMTKDEYIALSEEAYDDLRHEVADLISETTVTVTFPQADGETVPEVPESIRTIAREAFAGRPPDAEGVFALRSDRNPWRALDDALTAVDPAIRADERRKAVEELLSIADAAAKRASKVVHGDDLERGQASGLRLAAAAIREALAATVGEQP